MYLAIRGFLMSDRRRVTLIGAWNECVVSNTSGDVECLPSGRMNIEARHPAGTPVAMKVT